MPALYAPITAMLLGLIFRGVAFEFRWRTVRGKFLWDWAFAGGSLLAALAQGIALGALVQGIPVSGRAYAGGWWDWLTWFSLLTGVALVVGYALLGATWLIMKTSGEVQERARRFAWITGLGTLALIGLVSLITPFLEPHLHAALVRLAGHPLFRARAAVRGAGGVALFSGLYRRREAIALLRRDCAVRAVVHRPRHQLLSLHPAALDHHLGRGRARQQPEVPAGRRA